MKPKIKAKRKLKRPAQMADDLLAQFCLVPDLDRAAWFRYGFVRGFAAGRRKRKATRKPAAPAAGRGKA